MKACMRWFASAALLMFPLTGTAYAEASVAMKPKAWNSTATCGVERIGQGDHGKTQLKGTGKGKSKGEAEKVAQRDVQDQISRKYGKGVPGVPLHVPYRQEVNVISARPKREQQDEEEAAEVAVHCG